MFPTSEYFDRALARAYNPHTLAFASVILWGTLFVWFVHLCLYERRRSSIVVEARSSKGAHVARVM